MASVRPAIFRTDREVPFRGPAGLDPGRSIMVLEASTAVALDLPDGRRTEPMRPSMARIELLPLPPEPLRPLAVRLTRSQLARQDRNRGRATTWRRLLDRFGAGFTS